MKNILKFFTLAMMMSAMCLHVRGAAEPTKKYSGIDEAVMAHDLRAVREFLRDGALVSQSLLKHAINQIRKINGRLAYNYQPRSREIIEELLRAGTNVDKTDILCLVYEQMQFQTHLLEPEEHDKLMSQLSQIAHSIKKSGGTCDNFLNKAGKDYYPRVKDMIADIENASERFVPVREFFADPKLARPLPRAIIEGPIAEYVGAKEARPEQPTEEEEKAEAAQTMGPQAPTSEPGIKSLDEPE